MRLFVHVHDAGSVKKREVFPPAKVQELVERLMAALAIVKAREKVKDEGPGHEFHGNQWTGGLGSKPKEVKSKGVKMGVHELLSSGHPFTMEELQQVTGATTIKQISDALAMLKNPKYAGPKGTLHIVKIGNEYHIEANKGEAPKVDPDVELVSVKYEIPPPTKAEVATALLEPEDPDPEPEWEPGMENIGDPMAYLKSPSKPPATTMPKSEADAKYESHIASSLAIAQEAAKTSTVKEAPAIAMAFKMSKAKAMADWSANVKGIETLPKPQDVFKADLKLVDDLAQGMKGNEALAAWKKNTNAEKAGNFPPKVAINQMPKAAAPAAVEVKEHAPSFEVVPDYVPDGHVHVVKGDFLPALGKVNGEFSASMTSLKSKMVEGYPNSVQNKIGVQKALENRLADSPAFQELQKQLTAKGNGSLAARLISAWAGSSGDTQPISVANQISVREAFKMNPDHVSTGNMSNLHTSTADDDAVFAEAALTLGCKYSTPAEKATFKAGMRDFALAQYHNTQDYFKQLGIKEVCVVRGMKISHGAHSGAKSVDLKLQPASSFSANFNTAHSFSNGQTLYFSKVPASQVLGTYVTGFGCSHEHEVVVLAHPGLQAIQVPSGAAGWSLSSAVGYIRDSLADDDSSAKWAVSPAGQKAAVKASTKYVPAGVPMNAKNTYTKAAYEAAKKGDYEKLKELHETVIGNSKMPKSAKYIGKLKEGLQAHSMAQTMAKLTTPVKPSVSAPSGPKPEATKAVHVPHTGPAPYAHSIHSHYDPVEYQGWVAKGMSTHQLGKKLAMKKFLAKKAEVV